MSKLQFEDHARRWSPANDGVRFEGTADREVLFVASAEALQSASGRATMPSGDEAEAIFDEHRSHFFNAALRVWTKSDRSTELYLITDADIEAVIR